MGLIPLPAAGRRQRHTEFIGYTDEAPESLVDEKREDRALRRKARRELKWRGLRNVRKERPQPRRRAGGI